MTLHEATISASAYSYAVPAGKFLLGIELQGTADQSVSVGTGAGGNQIAGPIDVPGGTPWIGQQLGRSSLGAYTIHFSGLTGTNSLKIWLLG